MKVIIGVKGDGPTPREKPYLATYEGAPGVIILVGRANAIIIDNGKHGHDEFRPGTYWSNPDHSRFRPLPVGSRLMLEN